MNLALVKYNAGNIQSVLFALERLGVSAILSDEADVLQAADKIIFPGVGEAGSAMKYLQEKKLDKLIGELKQPVLGICLGMQLLCQHSEEADTDCIGVFQTRVKKFSLPGLKVPQVGWNQVSKLKSGLFRNIAEGSYCYFVHSYYAECCDESIAVSDYGLEFSSALQKDNFYGVQFHAEKSAATGEKILKNFLDL